MQVTLGVVSDGHEGGILPIGGVPAPRRWSSWLTCC